MTDLKAAIIKEIKEAMNDTQEDIGRHLDEAVPSFYDGGFPTRYDRTGALGETPETTNLSVSGDTVSFEAKLNNSGGYTSGKRPSMQDVLKLTNNGITNSSVGYLQPAVGRSGYWERAESHMQDDLDSAMSKHFD